MRGSGKGREGRGRGGEREERGGKRGGEKEREGGGGGGGGGRGGERRGGEEGREGGGREGRGEGGEEGRERGMDVHKQLGARCQTALPETRENGFKSEAVRLVLRPSDGPPRPIWLAKTRTSAGPAGTPRKTPHS